MTASRLVFEGAALDLRVLSTDALMQPASGHGPDRCIYCTRAVGELHRASCQVLRDRWHIAKRPARYRTTTQEE